MARKPRRPNSAVRAVIRIASVAMVKPAAAPNAIAVMTAINRLP
jgi:ribosomal protein S12